MPKVQKYATLSAALTAALGKNPEPVKEVIARALATWEGGGAGKTPAATASSVLLRLKAKGICAKPEVGMVCMGMEHPDYAGKRHLPAAKRTRKPAAKKATARKRSTASRKLVTA